MDSYVRAGSKDMMQIERSLDDIFSGNMPRLTTGVFVRCATLASSMYRAES